MQRVVIEKVIIPALRALQNPIERMWLVITLATLIVVVFVPSKNGTNTGNYHSPSNVSQVATIHATNSNTQPVISSLPLDNIKLPEDSEPRQSKDTFAVSNQ